MYQLEVLIYIYVGIMLFLKYLHTTQIIVAILQQHYNIFIIRPECYKWGRFHSYLYPNVYTYNFIS